MGPARLAAVARTRSWLARAHRPKRKCDVVDVLQKLAALKEAARLAAVARDEFVMPEGLSRKEQRQLLAKHKRVR